MSIRCVAHKFVISDNDSPTLEVTDEMRPLEAILRTSLSRTFGWRLFRHRVMRANADLGDLCFKKDVNEVMSLNNKIVNRKIANLSVP